jgi:hypothetical protein
MATYDTHPKTPTDDIPSLPIAGLCTAVSLAATVALLVGLRGAAGMMGEDGPVEIASAFLYAAAAGTLVLSAPMGWLRNAWHLPLSFVFATARELDLHKAFTTEGILQLRLYSGPAPLMEKAVGLALVALILWTAGRLARRGLGPLLSGIRGRQGWAWLAAAGLSAIGGAKVLLDGFGRKLGDIGIAVSGDLDLQMSHLEEWIELVGGIALLLAVLLWVRAKQRAGR